MISRCSTGPRSCRRSFARNRRAAFRTARRAPGTTRPGRGVWTASARGSSARKYRHDFHSELAYLGHEPPLKGDLTGRENLAFSVGIRRPVGTADIDAALTRTGALAFADRPARTLSAGQRRRVALAGVLLAQASLWLLDEPTTNLDADGQRLVAELIADHLARGGLVVAAVHHALPLPQGAVVPLELEAA